MSRPLRIAILAPLSHRVAPLHHGSREQIAGILADGLLDRGFEVAIFASGDSQTRATLMSVRSEAYADDPTADRNAWDAMHVANCFEQAKSFDLIHNHCGVLPLAFTRFVMTPVVTTIHDLSPASLPIYERYNQRTHLVAVSETHRSPVLDYAATIPGGIPVGHFELRDLSEGYLLFFGPIQEGAGVLEAIELARKVRRRLVISSTTIDPRFLRDEVNPRLDDLIEYIGPVAPKNRPDLFGGAAVMLHLGAGPEAFALSVIEAMACGTPVLASQTGAISDIVRPGENGFLVDTVADAAEALSRCLRLDRAGVRASVETRFEASRMVDAYASLYRSILPSSERSGFDGRNGAKRVIVRKQASAGRLR